MTLNVGPGQADKKAAEQRTAQVAADNKEQDRQQKAESEQAEQNQAKSAAEKVRKSIESGDDDSVEGAVVANPYPDYESKELSELRSEAEGRGVEINRDVEKAHLVYLLRSKLGHNPSWDLLPLEELRKVAKAEDVELDEEFELAQLSTELRAADTHTL